jgi:hypothetical protein
MTVKDERLGIEFGEDAGLKQQVEHPLPLPLSVDVEKGGTRRNAMARLRLILVQRALPGIAPGPLEVCRDRLAAAHGDGPRNQLYLIASQAAKFIHRQKQSTWGTPPS